MVCELKVGDQVMRLHKDSKDGNTVFHVGDIGIVKNIFCTADGQHFADVVLANGKVNKGNWVGHLVAVENDNVS